MCIGWIATVLYHSTTEKIKTENYHEHFIGYYCQEVWYMLKVLKLNTQGEQQDIFSLMLRIKLKQKNSSSLTLINFNRAFGYIFFFVS